MDTKIKVMHSEFQNVIATVLLNYWQNKNKYWII